MAQRVVILHVDIDILDAEVCRVDIQHIAAIRKTHTESHIVFNHIAKDGAHRETIAVGVDILDDEELVVGILVGGVSYGASDHPRALLDKGRRVEVETSIITLCVGVEDTHDT